MNKVLKLQRVGFMTPTVVEYEGEVLATNQLDIENTCNLWRCHFGFYPTEKIDLAMTKKEFSVIQQKTLSSVKSVYDLFYEYNFIPRVFDSNEEVSEWNMYRTNEVEKLKSENAELKSSLTHANEECLKWHERAQNLLKDSGGSISGYEKKISALQAENATLQERLEKAVELTEPHWGLCPYSGMYIVYYKAIVPKSEAYDDSAAAEAASRN